MSESETGGHHMTRYVEIGLASLVGLAFFVTLGSVVYFGDPRFAKATEPAPEPKFERGQTVTLAGPGTKGTVVSQSCHRSLDACTYSIRFFRDPGNTAMVREFELEDARHD